MKKKRLFGLFAASLCVSAMLCNCSGNQTADSKAAGGGNIAPLENAAEVASEQGVVTEIDEKGFDEYVGKPNSDMKTWNFAQQTPVLIDCYATWCGPCKQIAPNVEQIAKKYAGKIKVYKMDTEKCPRISQMLGITSIPTLIYGNPVSGDFTRELGYRDVEHLDNNVQIRLLSSKSVIQKQ